MTEVLVLVCLLAIGSMGLVSMFGDDLRTLFGASSEALAGNDAHGPTSRPRHERKTMKTFGYDPAGRTNGPE